MNDTSASTGDSTENSADDISLNDSDNDEFIIKHISKDKTDLESQTGNNIDNKVDYKVDDECKMDDLDKCHKDTVGEDEDTKKSSSGLSFHDAEIPCEDSSEKISFNAKDQSDVASKQEYDIDVKEDHDNSSKNESDFSIKDEFDETYKGGQLTLNIESPSTADNLTIEGDLNITSPVTESAEDVLNYISSNSSEDLSQELNDDLVSFISCMLCVIYKKSQRSVISSVKFMY